MTDDDWFDGSRRTLMMWVDGRDVRGHTTGGEPLTDVSWLLVLHADAGPITLTLPGMPYASGYFPVLDTGTPPASRPRRRRCRSGEPIVHPGPHGLAAAGRARADRGRRGNRRQAVVTRPISAGEASSSLLRQHPHRVADGAGPGQRQLRLVPVAVRRSNRCPSRRSPCARW